MNIERITDMSNAVCQKRGKKISVTKIAFMPQWLTCWFVTPTEVFRSSTQHTFLITMKEFNNPDTHSFRYFRVQINRFSILHSNTEQQESAL